MNIMHIIIKNVQNTKKGISHTLMSVKLLSVTDLSHLYFLLFIVHRICVLDNLIINIIRQNLN